MKRLIFVLLFFVMFKIDCFAQSDFMNSYRLYRDGYISGYEIDEQGDTVIICKVSDVIVFGDIGNIRKHRRLIRNVKAVYPYAQDARKYFTKLNEQLEGVESKRERDRITKAFEKEIINRYTPVLKKMTFSQGKILIKLIDRETKRTSFELLEDFRGKFAARFWNLIARIFSADLRAGYDADGEDRLIEQIIMLYEAGLL